MAEELDKLVNRFQRVLAIKPLKATKLFESIVQIAFENQETSAQDQIYKAASQLADFIKASSIYKQRRIAAAISQLDLLAKTLILREFKATRVYLLATSFSWEAALSSVLRGGKCRVYERIGLRKILAYGDNSYGRLGVGGEIEQATSLTEVQLPKNLKVSNIFMSKAHTIFQMEDGSFYGVGKVENFLSNGAIGIVTVPVKLDYVSVDPKKRKKKKPSCSVTEQSTIFHGYNGNLDLVVGKNEFRRIKEAGDNWTLINPGGPAECQDVVVKLESILDGEERMYFITPENKWNCGLGYEKEHRDIVLIICGRRVSTSKFGSDISFCKGGIVYAHRNGTLYKGQLTTAYRRAEGDCDNDKEARGDEGLVALMKEVVLPFSVDGFAVDGSGNSLIFYWKEDPDKEDNISETIRKMEAPWAPEIKFPKIEESYEPVYPHALQSDFLYFVQALNDDFASIMYSPPLKDASPSPPSEDSNDDDEVIEEFCTGLPIAGMEIFRALLTLRHFLRLRDDTEIPEVLLSLDSLDAADFRQNLQEAFDKSAQEGRKNKVLVAADVEKGEARTKEIIDQADVFFKDLLQNIMHSLECLVNLPLHYRRDERDTRVCYAVQRMINCIKSELEGTQTRYTFEQRSSGSDFVKQAIEDRLKNKEIDPEDPRFKPIRVEALPVIYSSNDGARKIDSFYLHTTSTQFFIKLIDEELLNSVKDGVLNLNNAYLQDPSKFAKMFKVFFESSEAHESFYNIETICSGLPDTEKYVVSTSDNQNVEVPAYLFQLFCDGFDAARLRSSNHSHLELPVPASSKSVKHLVEALLDVSSLYSVDMKTKEEIFHLVDTMLITHLKPKLIFIIVKTAEEQDFEFINYLFGVYTEDMIQNVGTYRPDIIFHWQNLPFDTSNLSIISRMTALIAENSFGEGEELPVTMTEDSHVDYEGIDKKWLMEALGGEDVKLSLTSSIMAWDGYQAKRKLKRKRKASEKKVQQE